VASKKENFPAFLPSRNLENMKKLAYFLKKNIFEGFPNLIKLHDKTVSELLPVVTKLPP